MSNTKYFARIQLVIMIVALGIITIYSEASSAAICTVSNAKVTNIFQWDDGHIFIYFDRDTSCNCSIPNRVAFHKDDNEKFLMSITLTAATSGKPVWIRAEDEGCVIHGNTARLKTFGMIP